MQRFKHILVDLALDGEDTALLAWAEQLALLSHSTKITVLHTWEAQEIPDSIRRKYPWLVEPGEELLSEKAKEEIASTLSPEWASKTEIRLENGDRLKVLLQVARDESVDLILSSRNSESRGAENHVCRLARKAPCSVFSPNVSDDPKYQKIVVPIDYSDHAKRALDFGCALARARKIPSITVLRCYAIPYGQHKATISREDFRAEYEAYEAERLDAFVAENTPEDVKLETSIVESQAAAYGIVSYSRANSTDVVVIGSRGLHAASAIFLGSTAESVLRDAVSSVLLIKPKGTGLSFLDSLLAE